MNLVAIRQGIAGTAKQAIRDPHVGSTTPPPAWCDADWKELAFIKAGEGKQPPCRSVKA